MEVQQISVEVAQDLHLDVTRAANVALEKHRVVSECATRFTPRLFQRGKIGGLVHHSHPAPTAAEGRLDDQREPDFLRQPSGLFGTGYGLLCARDHWNASLFRQLARGGLISQQLE